MKIVSVKFLNLNSLKGLHEIRFDKPPFSESNLFAITGPTGAGKTTILDAITVALYGRVHRHDKDAYECMTRHTGESYAEVEFEAAGAVYRSKWSIKRSRGKADGTMQQAKMELCHASTGEIIASHPLGMVQQKIVETCGLDYHQFLRSVMLSQGDFTRFLKANENERSELLEKMTDTGIYSQISTFVFNKAKEEQANLQNLSARLDDVRLLTDEELSAYREQMLELAEREKTLVAGKLVLTEQLQWLGKINGLLKKKQELQAEWNGFHTAYEGNRPAFDRLQLHKKVAVFKPALAEIDANLKNMDNTAVQILRIEEQLPSLQQVSDKVSGQLTEAEIAYGEAVKQQQDAEPRIVEAEKLDVLINSKAEQTTRADDALQKAIAECIRLQKEVEEREATTLALGTEIEHTSAWLQAHGHEAGLERTISTFAHLLEKLETLLAQARKVAGEQAMFLQQEKEAAEKLDSLAKQQQANAQQLEANAGQTKQLEAGIAALLSGKTLEELETEAAALPNLVNLCERQLDLVATIDRTTKFAQESVVKQEQLETQVAGETGLLEKLTSEHIQAREYLKVLQDNVKMQLLIRKYEEDRKTLKPDAPCPLCGAVHHPFVENSYRNESDETEQKLEEQQKKAEWLAQQVNDKKIALQSLQNQLANIREQQAGNVQEQQKAMAALQANNLQLPKPLDIGKPEVIAAIIGAKKETQAKLNQQIASIRSQEKQLQEWKNNANKLGAEAARLDSEKQQAQLRMEYACTSLDRLAADGAQLGHDRGKLEDDMSKTLEPHQVEFRLDESRAILLDLKSRAEKFLAKQNELQQKKNVLVETRSGLHHAQQQLAEKVQLQQQLADEYEVSQAGLAQLKEQRVACFGDKDTKAERQRHALAVQTGRDNSDRLRKESGERKQALEIAKSQLAQLIADKERRQQYGRQLSETMLQRIQAAGFESTEVVRQHIMPDEEAERIEKLYQDAERQRTAIARLLKETEEEFNAETAKNMTEDSSETLSENIRVLEQSISEILQETGRVKQIINAEEHNREKYRQLVGSIELQRKETMRWEKLSKLIGSADGKKFRNYAHSLTLERLVKLANRHVGTFTDRYLIRKMPQRDLEFEIVDRYQADIVRPVTSLSGGESFLISLALALGLSELASRNTQINSLFIDEGFGMLDADTLDVAVSALENLRANGKTIGIISHVEALKERIGTQVQVVKRQGGHSDIRIVAYGQIYG